MFRALISAAAVAATVAGAAAALAQPMPPGQLTSAKNLDAEGMATGYTLHGELFSSNSCMDTRFVANRMVDSYDAQQYKRPGSGPVCGQIAMYKKTELTVKTTRKPRYVYVHVAGPKTIKMKVGRP